MFGILATCVVGTIFEGILRRGVVLKCYLGGVEL